MREGPPVGPAAPLAEVELPPQALSRIRRDPRFRGTLTRGDQTFAVFSEKLEEQEIQKLREVK